jgi:hypothetical protein
LYKQLIIYTKYNQKMKIRTHELLDALTVIKYGNNATENERENIQIDKDESKILKRMIKSRVTDKYYKKYKDNKIKLIIKCINNIILNNKDIEINQYYEPLFKSEKVKNNDEIKMVDENQYYMYIGYIGQCDEYYIFKYGYTFDIDRIIKTHEKEYGMFKMILYDYFFPKNITRVTQNIEKRDPYCNEIKIKISEYLVENRIARIPFINKSRRKDIFGIKNLDKLDEIIDKYKNIMNDSEPTYINKLKNENDEIKKQIEEYQNLKKKYRTLEKQIKLQKKGINNEEIANLQVNYEDAVARGDKYKKELQKFLKICNDKDIEIEKLQNAIDNKKVKQKSSESKTTPKRGRPKMDKSKELILD